MKDIKNKAEHLLKIVDEAIEWTDISYTGAGLVKPFNSIRRNLTVIQNSLKKRPSIAIFGQSQVGKSYLVQNLAKPFNAKFLKIKVAKNIDDKNFLTDFNPDGGKESTGLVTRFTTKKVKNDGSFPFEIELFSQLDIAAILTNAFCSDLKDFNDSVFEFEKEDLKAIWQDLDTNSVQKGATADEAYFLNQYINSKFKDFALIKELSKKGYFIDLVNRIHLVKPKRRVDILKYLWGQNKFFTQLFKILSDGIEKLEFNRDVRIQLEALTPNTKSIIDVERVREIFNKSNDKPLEIKLPNNEIKTLSRSVLSIITREVQLQLAHDFKDDEPQSFLNESDLLDFPGSKSREKIPLSVFENNNAEDKLQLLIRGKVSFLFDSYITRLGVSTLLYCMDNNPPEEKEAPSRLHNWIKNYIGSNQEDRERTMTKTKELLKNQIGKVDQISPLLIVFTKFNVELNKILPGQETNVSSHDSKWLARFQENFVNFMSRPVDDKWVTNWTINQPEFQFIFPIRDPLYSQATFEGLDDMSIEKEVRVRPERFEAMQAMGTSFTGNDIVNKHTLDAQLIWNEISTPNNSGILFLSNQLRNSSHPIVTKTRLGIELDKAYNEIFQLLKPHQVSGNLNQDLEEAKKKGGKSFFALTAIANKQGNILSNILNKFLLNDTEIWNLVYDTIFGMSSKNDESDKISNNNNEIIHTFKELGINLELGMTKESILIKLREILPGYTDKEIEKEIIDNFSINLNELPAMLAIQDSNSNGSIVEVIINFWIEKTMNMALDDNILQNINDNQKEVFRDVLLEIIKSKDRLNLKELISKKIRNIKSGTIGTEDIDFVASYSTALLNKFLFTAGWGLVHENDKPITMDNNKIFSSFGKEYQKENIDYSTDNEKEFFKQWNVGIRKIFEENVKFNYNLDGKNINTIANKKLDNILESLKVDY